MHIIFLNMSSKYIYIGDIGRLILMITLRVYDENVKMNECKSDNFYKPIMIFMTDRPMS